MKTGRFLLKTGKNSKNEPGRVLENKQIPDDGIVAGESHAKTKRRQSR